MSFSHLIKHLEPHLLPVVQRPDENDDENGNKDSDACDTIYCWLSFGVAMTKVLEEAERQRDGLQTWFVICPSDWRYKVAGELPGDNEWC